VYRLEGAARWTVAALAMFVAALLLISGYAVRRTIDFLGVRPVRPHWRREAPPDMPVIVEGPYRWVRHPLYSCILALFWIRPEVMADGLLLDPLERLDRRRRVPRGARPGRGPRRRVPPLPAPGAHVGSLARTCAAGLTPPDVSAEGGVIARR